MYLSLNKFYYKKVKSTLINKFLYYDLKKIPSFNKITLQISLNTTDLRKLLSGFLALEFISNQQSFFLLAKKTLLDSKIHKGNPISCKSTLQKQNLQKVLNNFIFTLLPKRKEMDTFYSLTEKSFSWKLQDNFHFYELEKNYSLFNNLPKINFIFEINFESKTQLIFLINYYFNFCIKIIK